MFEALDKSKKRSQLEPKTLISLKTSVYSLSLSFLLTFLSVQFKYNV